MHDIDSRQLRSLIDRALVTDSDLDAFVIDHFPAVKKRFSTEMNRVSKVNLLFECVDIRQIANYLYLDHPTLQPNPYPTLPPTWRESSAIYRPPHLTSKPEAARGSPWLDTLSTYRGGTQVVLALLCFVGALTSGPAAISGQRPPGSALVALLVGVTASVLYVRAALHRQRVRPVSLTRFVGPQPLTQLDRERRGFYGRDDEIESILNKLATPEIRHLVLVGESGCGKTSLLLAGVIPELEQHGRFHSIYLRFSDQPLQSLRTALHISSPGISPEAQPSPIKQLHAIWQQVGKPIILFIDQFEEFHINPITESDYNAIRELVWSIAGKHAVIDAKIVFCMRYDFLHLMDVFYDKYHVDSDFANGEVRLRIEPFEAKVAEEVVFKSLRRSDGLGLEWSSDLIHRVLDDLTMTRIIHGQRKSIILPSELQIVFQMVHAKRIDSATSYPGKRRLLLDYISEAIDTTPGADPSQAKQLLLCLTDANGVTRAKPQTLAQLAEQLRQEPGRLRRMLEHLDHRRHIVRSFSSKQPNGQLVVAYELAHDYLAGLIRTVAGQELSGVRHSQAILHAARMQAEYSAKFHLSLRECWQLIRYPASETTSDDRRLLSTSLLHAVLTLLTPTALVCSTILFLRFGLVHFDFDQQHLVVRRGLPFLSPILGSRDHYLEIGITNNQALVKSPAGIALIAQLQDNPLRPQLLAFLRADWDMDTWLRRQLQQALARSSLPSHDPRRLSMVDDELTALLIALDLNDDDMVAHYSQQLRHQFEQWAARCQASETDSQQCRGALGSLADTASQIYALQAKNPTLASYFVSQVKSLEPETWAFAAAYKIVRTLSPNDPSINERVLKLLDKSDAHRAAVLLTRLTRSFRSLHDEPAIRKRVIYRLRSGLAELTDKRERSLRLRGLAWLGLPNEPVVEYLFRQYSAGSLEDKVDALRGLLHLRVQDPRLDYLLLQLYKSARSELEVIGSLDSEAKEALAAPERNPYLYQLVQILGYPETTEGLINSSPEIRSALTDYLKVDLRSSSGLFFRAYPLFQTARRSGVPLQELLRSLPERVLASDRAYRQYLYIILNPDWLGSDARKAEALMADRSILSEIERLIKSSTTDQYYGCMFANISLAYRISDPAAEKRITDPACAEWVDRMYALRRLLPQTEGIAQPDTPGSQAGPAAPIESYAQASERLIAQLHSRQAAQSLVYRAALLSALEIIIAKQKKSNPIKSKELLHRLRIYFQDHSTPFYMRLSLAQKFSNFADSDDDEDSESGCGCYR